MDQSTNERGPSWVETQPVKAGVKFEPNDIVQLDANGLAVVGASATGRTTRGLARFRADNTDGVDGAIHVEIANSRTGKEYLLQNDTGAGELKQEHVGKDFWVKDGDTATADSTGRSLGGEVTNIEKRGVWVQFK